ncbi:hypothetical protein CEUSTIGMA_g6945.t1 [Chlamydomonas eustigma]|uniref:PCI domain-containing protein n=1 Tax=Chlamydomonas eustigma TaxID=1157962 RepID=A0A250X8U9_9CHLO|nr:hypothetical protein CEUSTIGMA_g6945.t1 [Chlamydomonas eustigma]|eukprot:GAX79504.1 hypothetical protein CEUSTIGMA_g6945.t1 [Chlamydomonas eustigma]
MTIQMVETGEENPFVSVVEEISNLLNEESAVKTALAETKGSKFLDECVALIAAEKFDSFLSKALEHLDLVFTKFEDKDSECIANVLVHTIAKVSEEKAPAAAKGLALALASKVDERSEQRLSALLNLYNVTSNKEVQLPVLLVTAEYARKHTRLASMLTAVVKGRAENWVSQWGLSDTQARELYLTLAALVKASQDKGPAPIEYLRLVIAALKLAVDGDTEALTQLKPHAASAVAEYTRNPAFYQADLGELPAVKTLASDPQYAPLYKLMTCMLSGDISSFRSAATSEALELAGVSAEAALSKARTSALLALGTRAGHEEVSFTAIQTALDIPEEQVELFVVRAIGAKLLEGKIDQVKGSVSITRCTMRSFGHAEWKAVKTRLASWKESLVSVQANLVANKTGAASAGVPARGQQAIRV